MKKLLFILSTINAHWGNPKASAYARAKFCFLTLTARGGIKIEKATF